MFIEREGKHVTEFSIRLHSVLVVFITIYGYDFHYITGSVIPLCVLCMYLSVRMVIFIKKIRGFWNVAVTIPARAYIV